MRSIGMGELLAVLASVVGLAFYAFVFFIFWRFYQLLEKISENVAGIRQALEKDPQTRLFPGGDR